MSEFRQTEHEPVVARIRKAANRGTLSHALLFTGSGDRISTARFAAAAMECTAEHGQPCGVCSSCRKVFSDIHPDVMTVRDDAHQCISVEVMRAVRADVYIRPNEGRRKIYLFPDCTRLSEQGQNILLKVVEEGPPYAAFLFCAENPAAVLQTLRSRCVELKLQPVTDTVGESSEHSVELCRAVGNRKRGAIAELAARLEKKKLTREELAAMLARSREVFVGALLVLYRGQAEEHDRETAAFLARNLTKKQIMSTIEILQKYHGECVYYVGVGHVLGALAAELEGIL